MLVAVRNLFGSISKSGYQEKYATVREFRVFCNSQRWMWKLINDILLCARVQRIMKFPKVDVQININDILICARVYQLISDESSGVFGVSKQTFKRASLECISEDWNTKTSEIPYYLWWLILIALWLMWLFNTDIFETLYCATLSVISSSAKLIYSPNNYPKTMEKLFALQFVPGAVL